MKCHTISPISVKNSWRTWTTISHESTKNWWSNYKKKAKPKKNEHVPILRHPQKSTNTLLLKHVNTVATLTCDVYNRWMGVQMPPLTSENSYFLRLHECCSFFLIFFRLKWIKCLVLLTKITRVNSDVWRRSWSVAVVWIQTRRYEFSTPKLSDQNDRLQTFSNEDSSPIRRRWSNSLTHTCASGPQWESS